MDEFGRVWTCLDAFGRVWTRLNAFGQGLKEFGEVSRSLKEFQVRWLKMKMKMNNRNMKLPNNEFRQLKNRINFKGKK